MIQFKLRRTYLGFLIWLRVNFTRKSKQELWRELFLLNVLFTNVYERQSVQDRITSLSRLILLFKDDHGFIPKFFLRILYKMNRTLNKEVVKHFEESYRKDIKAV